MFIMRAARRLNLLKFRPLKNIRFVSTILRSPPAFFENTYSVYDMSDYGEGDFVEEGEFLCYVDCGDKIPVTILAPFSGVITKRFFNYCDDVKPGQPLHEINDFREDRRGHSKLYSFN